MRGAFCWCDTLSERNWIRSVRMFEALIGSLNLIAMSEWTISGALFFIIDMEIVCYLLSIEGRHLKIEAFKILH